MRQNELVRESSKRAMADSEKRVERNRKQCEWYKNSDKTRIREYRKKYELPESTKIKKKAWVAQRRADHMARLVELLGGECRICGLRDDPISYDFHHIDPKFKKFTISQRAGTVSWDSLWKEAQKCALLCAICHRKVTHGKIEQPDWVEQSQKESKSSD